MRVRIDAKPGELEARADDMIAAVRKLAGKADCCNHGDLQKAAPVNTDQIPRKLDLPALQGGVDRASKVVQKIRRRMLADMLEVLKEAK